MKADVVVKAHESLFPRLARKNSTAHLAEKTSILPHQRSSSQESPTKNPGVAGTVCDRQASFCWCGVFCALSLGDRSPTESSVK